MCGKMAGMQHIVIVIAILALSNSFSAAKSTKTKLSVGAKISASNSPKDDVVSGGSDGSLATASNSPKDDVVSGGSDGSLATDVDERKRCHCDKLTPNSKPDNQPAQYDRPEEFNIEDWPDKLRISGLPSEFGSSGSISISGSIGAGGGIKYKPQPVVQDSSDSSSSIEPSVPSSADLVEEPIKISKPNSDFTGFPIPEISSVPLELKPIQPVSIGEVIEKPRPVKKQIEKKQSKTTVTYSKVKQATSTPTKTSSVQGLTCPNV